MLTWESTTTRASTSVRCYTAPSHTIRCSRCWWWPVWYTESTDTGTRTSIWLHLTTTSDWWGCSSGIRWSQLASKRTPVSFTCAVPRTRLGDRSFAVAGPRVWHYLPAALRAVEEYEQFKKLLKHICSIGFRRLVILLRATKRVLAIVILSVRPSVTTRYRFKPRWDRDSGSSPYDSLESLVSYEVIWCHWVRRFPSNEGIKEGNP